MYVCIVKLLTIYCVHQDVKYPHVHRQWYIYIKLDTPVMNTFAKIGKLRWASQRLSLGVICKFEYKFYLQYSNL